MNHHSSRTARRAALALSLTVALLAGTALVVNGCAMAPQGAVQVPPASQPQSSASGNSPVNTSDDSSTPAAGESVVVPNTTVLKIKDIVVGDGDTAAVGDHLLVNYTGWLADGTKIDSSYDRSQSLPFVLGKGEVIPGWDKGIVGMRVGGKRELIIPPNLAYGSKGTETIPTNATMRFVVELVGVQAP